MRKKVICKVLMEYKKKVAFRRVSQKTFEHLVQYRKPIYDAKFGIRYNTETCEMVLGGCQCLEFEMRWFVQSFFKGNIVQTRKNFSHKKQRYVGRIKIDAKVSKSNWKEAKRKLQGMVIHGSKNWKVTFNTNLSNIMN